MTKKQNDKGKWVASSKPFHGAKWILPITLVKFFNRNNVTLTGRNIQGDITRLQHVFGPDAFRAVGCVDIQELRQLKQYSKASKPNGLGDWLQRVTGFTLADKGNKALRTKHWATQEVLSKKQQNYATLDGIASYVLGLCNVPALDEPERAPNR